MGLSDADLKKIVQFVQKEPRTVQDIARFIGRSWVTAESYVGQIISRTGSLRIKTFRKGTQGALKLVYYNYASAVEDDVVRQELFEQVKRSRWKTEFDFMEVFQFIPEKKKRSFIEHYDDIDVSKSQDVVRLLRQAEKCVYFFSGNASFINLREGKLRLLDVIEELLARKVFVKILCRANIASVSNLHLLLPLLKKYPGFIEVRHRYHPLRGFVVDEKIARFKEEEQLQLYKPGELDKNTRIFYEIYDKDWISWFQNVFIALFRSSIDYQVRLRELERIG